jgi:type II secretory ATPase GspE/PulE/Tfp pilus assembly ATPase PilB-like protein/CheY-like chemotaxis protein
MSNASPRPRPDDHESDEWLIDAARRAGHQLPNRERSAGTTSWRVLLNAGISEAEVLRLACAAAGTEAADFTRLSAAMGSLLAHGVALKHRVVPLGVHGGALDVATSNPRSPALERELAFAAKQRVRLHAASPSDIIRAQAVVYGTAYGNTKAEVGGAFVTGVPAPPSVMQPRPTPVARLTLQTAVDSEVANVYAARKAAKASAAAPAAAPAAPTPDMTDRLLAAAIAERASEAVLEPTPDGGLLVRLRIDGTLNDRFRIAETHTARLTHTLKQRAQLDVAETKQKQHGRATFESASGLVAVRVATAPHRDGGERVVLRLFTSQGLLGLTELGYSSPEHHRLGQILVSKGLIIVAGLAGAGKTTTLYAAARELRKQGLPVSTVEEPIDYPLERIDQVQVSESPHLSVGAAVETSLRAHGGVVMVGAPLDAPAMDLCVAEGARGRLVLASLGTADMPATLSQLFELHPDRASLGTALHGIVVQRLLRRLCSCAVSQSVSELPEQQQRLLYGLPAAKVRRPVGCAKCRTTGYLGRLAIVELIPMTGPLRIALAGGATPAELAQVAKENGMTTLWDSGLNRVLEGVTSLSELLDTVPPPPEEAGEAAQEDIDALLKQLLGTSNMKPEAATSAMPAAAAAPVAPAARPAPPPVAPAPAPAAAAPKAPPAAVVAPPPPAAVKAPRITPTPTAPASIDTGMLRILLVDDDATARRVLAHALTQSGGIQVLQASDGITALAFTKRLRPHIVLTEVALPGLDAIGLLTAFAEEESPPMVVVYTEQADGALDSWLLESGAREVLRRDLPPAALARRLKELAEEG